MRFGWLAEQRFRWTELLDVTGKVEQLGFDSVWLSDHLADEQGHWLLDPWTTLGAILGRVPRVEAGTLVASNSLRPQLLTAHMARTLAEIGSGRFVLGLGAGGSRDEHRKVGVAFDDLERRVAALREGCELIRRAVTADSPWSDGRATPQAGRPAIPLLLGGGGPTVLRLAGRYADRWTIWGTPEELANKGAVLSEFARDADRRPEDIRRGAIVMVLPDHVPERSYLGHWPAELRGDEAAVLRQLADYAAAGVDDVIVCDYGVDPAYRVPTLEWFASIMSRFKEATAPEASA
jgi:alkanesulfonate monooxygenase SsuD/methylene tetrahydromethanopterin reductase-like flavin-dependent oxidoreductase (luciferase family)